MPGSDHQRNSLTAFSAPGGVGHGHSSCPCQAPGKLGDSCLGVARRRKLTKPTCGAVPQEEMGSFCRPERGVLDLDLPRAEVLLLHICLLVSSQILACIVGLKLNSPLFFALCPVLGATRSRTCRSQKQRAVYGQAFRK